MERVRVFGAWACKLAVVFALVAAGLAGTPKVASADYQNCLCDDMSRCSSDFYRFCCNVEGGNVHCGCTIPLWGCSQQT
jgi:hypothetical protein